ncbi:MAG: hypothetical protein ACRDQA_09760 [Nocardioidaceae bacterium]
MTDTDTLESPSEDSHPPGAAVEVPTADTAVLDDADPETAAALVTNALQESKAWLSQAMTATDPTPIAAFKAWAATVEEATRQKKLGREIELDAAEMVRRAERGLGQAVRRGQADGTIRTQHPTAERRSLEETSTSGFFSCNRERVDSYGMSDDVTDDTFDAAVAAAKEEQNLSRANLVRKTRQQQQAETTDRWDQIAALAGQGHTSTQIASKVGLTAATVRRGARDRGIPIRADELVGRTRRLDSDRIVAETVRTLDGAAVGLDLIDYTTLDPDQLPDWISSLAASLRTLNRLARQLKHTHHNIPTTQDQMEGTTR